MQVSGQLHGYTALPPGTHRNGRCAEEKNLHCRESNLGRPARSPLLYRLPN
jgi:hypothetical protein